MTTDTDAWKGRAETDDSERTQAESTDDRSLRRIRRRGFHLLGWMLRPHLRGLVILTAILLTGAVANLAAPFFVMLAIDHAIPRIVDDGSYDYLTWIAAGFVVITVVDYLATRLFIVRSAHISQEMLLRLRRRVFQKFQRLSISFHERFTSGRVVSRQTSDMDSIREMTANGVEDLVLAAFSIVIIAVYMLIMDPLLALVSFTALPAMYFLARWFSRVSAIAYRRSRETIADLIVYFVESMGRIKAVQANRREERDRDIFSHLNTRNRLAQAKGQQQSVRFGSGTKAIGNTAIVAIVLFGGRQVMEGTTELGVLAAFVLYLRRFFDPIQELAMFYNSLQSGGAALEKLSGVLDEPNAVKDPDRPRDVAPVRGSLTFDRVEFRYRDGELVLPQLDLHIPAGQTVAVLGPTGAGKTTIAKLVARFHDPVEGSILLDDTDLRHIADADLRRNVTLITQENFLFDGTIAENIELGRPGAERAEVVAAADLVGATGFISQMTDGFDTRVSKRGGRLSAGQRQLVVFARAVLADPRVLILDEATSSLDVPSERLVQKALKTILADRTSIIIAHRLSTVQIADRVVIVEDGKIVEDGSPETLALSGQGKYAELHRQWQDSLV
ncbi:ABC transporter ATP-binding protein [Haloglycomyces albus]|uniref:ABC transporter ATP-binding protein n=1 Tax=Haloglycomyces albus TaxID=526067 RepID=UPI0004AF3DB1|nr:ABC transporter ATP-binding protein [Haloglycomyces albus]